MAMTPSTMLPLETVAPTFSLFDTVTGQKVTLTDLPSAPATVVMFICNHCPFVVHILPRLVEVARDYGAKGVSFVAISSNDVINYPDDSPPKMKALAESHAFSFPYLYDESQEVAKAYQAACTPDFYLFDGALKLVYRGQFDASRPGNAIAVTGRDLTEALDALMAGKPVSASQNPSIGCNIKWKK